MGNFQKFLLLEIRYNLYFADNSVKLLAFLVMQCLWCIFFNVLLLKCIPLSLVFFKQLFPQAQVSFLVFNSKYSKARVFVFCGEGECELDLCSSGYVGIQLVWEVRLSHQVIQLVIKSVPWRSLINYFNTQTFPKVTVRGNPMFKALPDLFFFIRRVFLTKSSWNIGVCLSIWEN